MPTFYLDYEGGSDAADGTTFANRWKTITSGATAARIAPGDTIRIMASPDPTSLGINATWTNKSRTITLASALNVLITNCDSAWTASANVTCTASTTRRTGTNSVSHAIASGFTTGKAAYFDLGSTQDYSGYQGVTFWMRCVTGTFANSVLTLRLCSDTTGDTAVTTLAIPAINQINQWVPIYIDFGAALSSTVRTIALYAESDPGTLTVLMDNISTVKAAGTDALNLQTLIGKNSGTEPWMALREINGTTLTIDSTPTTDSAQAANDRGYLGTTGTVTTYIRKTIHTDLGAASSTSIQVFQDNGSAGSLIAYSGGWNRTDMSTQTAETWFDGRSGFGRGIVCDSTRAYTTISKVHVVRYDIGYYYASSGVGNTMTGTIIASHSGYGFNIASGPSGQPALTLDTLYCLNNGNAGFVYSATGTGYVINTLLNASCNGGTLGGVAIGMYTSNDQQIFAESIVCDYNFVGGVGTNTGLNADSLTGLIKSLSCADNVTTACNLIRGKNLEIYTMTITGSTNGILFQGGSDVGSNLNTFIRDLTMTNMSSVGFNVTQASGITIGKITTSGNTNTIYGGALTGDITILEADFAEASPIQLIVGGNYGQGWLRINNYKLTGQRRNYYNGANNPAEVFSVADADRHTGSGIAWKVSPKTTTEITSIIPLKIPVGKIFVANGVAKTVKLWVKRDNTGLTCKLVIPGGRVTGVATSTTDLTATASAGAGTYEELSSGSFTPTQDGVIEVWLHVWATATTYNMWFDDLSIV